MKILALALVAPLSLAACMQPMPDTSAPTAPPVGATPCGSQNYMHLIGQPSSALQGVVIPNTYRVVGPNMPMTMDLNENRINFILDAQGKIESIYCA